MNKAQAEKEGLQFTGCYDFKNTNPKAKAASIRKQGFRAIVVYETAGKNSRGYKGGGYSVYAERAYFVSRTIIYIEEQLSRIDSRKAEALKQYEDSIASINAQEAKLKDYLAELTAGGN